MSRFVSVIALLALIGILAGCASHCTPEAYGAAAPVEDNGCNPCGKFTLSWEQLKHDFSRHWFWQQDWSGGICQNPCAK